LIVDTDYPRDPAMVSLLPGAVAGLSTFRQHGFLLVLISNQSGVGRGLVSPDEARSVHDRLVEVLGEAGVNLDGFYYCFHVPEEGCDCRKPSPGLVLRAASELAIDTRKSFMIGDKLADVEAGGRAGCTTVLFGWPSSSPAEGQKADFVAEDWERAAQFVIARTGSKI